MLSFLRSRQFAPVAVCLLVLAAAPAAYASFSLTFQGLVRDINSGGAVSLHNPSAVVVDGAGNTYVSDTSNSRIVEFDAHGVASVLAISGLSPSVASPSALAIDGSGNLYIADAGNSRIVKVSPSGAGSVVSTGSVAITSPRGVAVDQSGDIFISDTGNNRIVEVTSGGSAAVLTITVSSGSSTFSSPMGLAVNVAGKLYIADAGNNRIVSVAPGSTTGVVTTITGGVTLSGPKSVAVDRIGNIIIADSFNSRVAEIDTSGNGTVLYTGSNSLNGPIGVTVDPFGTIYIADTGDNRVLVVDPPVNGDLISSDPTYSLNQSVIGFGHIQLGSSSAVTLTMEFTTGQVGLGAVKVLTAGTENLDFTSGPDTTCNSSTGASTVCFVEVNFLPTAPGLRQGTVVLYDTSLNPLLTLPIYGYADAPVAALSPNTGSLISTGSVNILNPFELALDGAGNLYVGNYSAKNVVKVPAGGGAATVLNLGSPGSPATAPQNITGVAVDGAGNLFISDYENNRILVMTPGGVVSVLAINGSLSPSLGAPTALSFDSAGNLYIADRTNGKIIEVSSLVVAGTSSSGKGTFVNTGSYSFAASTLSGLAVDSLGNIYVAAGTQNSSSIIKITNAGVVSAVAIPGNITPAINGPQGVAVDGMGNLYIMDSANSRVVKITTAGVATALSIKGLTSPASISTITFGITVDSSGNLYIPDWNSRLIYVNVSSSALGFASTNIGSTSSDSPQTATVTNLGNLPLVFSASPAFTADFVQNGSDTNPCASGTSLSPGILCDVAVKFTPQSAGGLSANIAVTNNTLNVAGSTQQVMVSGTGINPGDTTATTVTSVTPSSAVYGQAITIVAKVSDTQSGHATTIPTGSVAFIDTFQSTVQQLSSTAIDGSGNAMLTGVVLNGLGAHTITASYAGVSNTFIASNGSGTVMVGQASTTVSGPSQPVTLASGQAGTVAITVKSTVSGSSAPSGSVTYSILNSSNTSVSTGTVALAAGSGSSAGTLSIPGTLAAGTYTISVNYTGDTNYQSSTAIISLTVGKLASSVSGPSQPVALSIGQAGTFVITVKSAVSGSSVPSGSVTYSILNSSNTSVSTGTVALAAGSGSSAATLLIPGTLAAGTYTISVNYTGDANYQSSTAIISLTVSKLASSVALLSSANPAILTNVVTLTATASSTSGTPTGTVSFFDGTTLLGTATLSQGNASFTTAGFATGSHSITAVYSGDGNDLTSTSAAVMELIQDFSLTVGTPGSITLPVTAHPGGAATYTLSFGPNSGTVFLAPVTLTVSGLPSGATATLSPQILPAGSGLTTVTLAVQLPQQTALYQDMKLVGPVLALIFLPFAGRKRRSGRKLQRLCSVLLLAILGTAATAGLTGCGAQNSGSGQLPQNYNIVITGTSGNLSHSTSVTLIVK